MPVPVDPMAYHLVATVTWTAAPLDEPFRPTSLDAEGFVHLTHHMADLVDVANDLYRHESGPHVVLTIALRWLSTPWRYDGDDRYPHVYGPLDRRAITEVRSIARDMAGAFLPIERPDERRRPDMPSLLRLLSEAGVAFVVVGSSGAALLGAELVPGDLDICPSPGAGNLRRLASLLREIGARPRVGVPGWVTEEEARAWQPTPDLQALELLYETPYGDLDVLAAVIGPGGRGYLEHKALVADSVTTDVGGIRVVVASPAHLLASKVGARRPKDLRALGELERLVSRGANAPSDSDASRAPDARASPRSGGEAELRRAGPRDADAIVDVYLASLKATYDFPPAHTDAEIRQWICGELIPTQEVWVAAAHDGTIVALMALTADMLDQLYVAPGSTGHGIGSRLLGLAKTLRPGGLDLYTFQANSGARRFYERHCFVEVARGDGSGNEEGQPDIRYAWRPRPRPGSPSEGSATG